MSTDNRTIINDCEANTGWTGSDAATAETGVGLFFENITSLSSQYSNAGQEEMFTTHRSSTPTGIYNLDWADSTVYMLLKDNLSKDTANQGIQFVIGDGTNTFAYDIGGIDARGVQLASGFFSLRMDVSVIVAVPGGNTLIKGTETSMDQTAMTEIGYGGEHASKAVGAIDNLFMDCFRYISNVRATHTGNGIDDLDFSTGATDDITRVTSGVSFITDGFTVGATITITGSASNNLTTEILTVSATVIGVAATLTAETNVAATITQQNFALTVNGGTSGTPETNVDLIGDDEAGGWGMVANPFGAVYLFGAPTEWGNVNTVAEHAFAASDEQWFMFGDNGGGKALGATHFPMRFVSNSTDTGEIKLTNVVITGLSTRAEWLMDNADFNTIELESVTFSGAATISLPSSGGTSRFATNCTFSDCDQVTHNGANMSGSSVLVSNVGAGVGALLYNETADPDGETDNMTFSQGATAHSAFEFGTAVTSNITLRGIDFTGFGSTDDVDGAIFLFLATSGSLNLNLVGCSTDGTFSVDDTAGIAVTVVIDPVTTLVNVKDNTGANLINTRVLLEAADAAGDFHFDVTPTSITRSGTTATVTITSHKFETGDIIIVRGSDDQLYNGAYIATDATANTIEYTMTGTPAASPATGTLLVSGGIIDGLTDASGNISTSRTFTLPQLVKGVARKSTSSPRFKSFPLAGTISTTLGLTINIQLIIDE